MSGCQTCGGFGMHHDPTAHDLPEQCEHDWAERGTPGDEWLDCWLCGEVKDA